MIADRKGTGSTTYVDSDYASYENEGMPTTTEGAYLHKEDESQWVDL